MPPKDSLSILERLFEKVDIAPMINYRKKLLHRFMNRVANNPIVQSCDLFGEFLLLSDEQFAKKKRLKYQSFSDTANSTFGTLFSKKTKEPEWMTKFLAYTQDLLKVLTNFRATLLVYIDRLMHIGHSYQEFAEGMGKLALIEKEKPVTNLTSSLDLFNKQFVKLSAATLEEADAEKLEWLETMDYYSGLCIEVARVIKVIDSAICLPCCSILNACVLMSMFATTIWKSNKPLCKT